MKIKSEQVHRFREIAEEIRAQWKQRGITAQVCGLSGEAYEECLAQSVLERQRIEVTPEHMEQVLAIMAGK